MFNVVNAMVLGRCWYLQCLQFQIPIARLKCVMGDGHSVVNSDGDGISRELHNSRENSPSPRLVVSRSLFSSSIIDHYFHHSSLLAHGTIKRLTQAS